MSQPELPPFQTQRTAPSAPPPPPIPPVPPVEAEVLDAPVGQTGKRRRAGFLLPIIGGLIGSALTVGALWLGGVFEDDVPITTETDRSDVVVTSNPVDETAPGAVTITPLDGSSRVSTVAARAIPSIVTVEVGDNVPVPSGGATESVFHAFATGSGVVFRSDGYILTNNHVVEDTVITKVVFSDGRKFEAEVIGTDPLTDIAVLKIDASELPTIEFANISELAIGDEAIAVGSPLGLEGGPSVTAGVVSAFNRQLNTGPGPNDSLYGLLQTDAPITLGSSGGALLNGEAQLIGITTAIGVSDVGAEGLGFAVPVDMVERLSEDLIVDGRVKHAYLGIGVDDAMIDLGDGAEVPAGAVITGFASGSAIQLAGADVGDVIIELNSIPVSTKFDLLSILRSFRAGDRIDILVTRSDDEVSLTVELGLRPDDL